VVAVVSAMTVPVPAFTRAPSTAPLSSAPAPPSSAPVPPSTAPVPPSTAPVPPSTAPVPPSVDYTGAESDSASLGMLRREDRGDHYLVTTFEPDGARRVFPCFDEPGFKVPWTIDLTVPAGMMALGNAPVAREADEGGGRHHVWFRPTPPLPP